MKAGLCKDCAFLVDPKFPPPGDAIGQCLQMSHRYGEGLAWAEVGNMFVPVYVTATFGCIRFERKA